MKKRIIVIALLTLFVGGVFAQQMTRFGVVDTAMVYSTYFRDSSAVRNYESKKTSFQNEISKLTEEIETLQKRKISFTKAEKETDALKVEAQIAKKTDFLTEYTRAKNIELESLRKNLKSSDEFYKKLYQVIGHIAETNGYSMILSLHQANAILWYSPTVDITNDVIAELSSVL